MNIDAIFESLNPQQLEVVYSSCRRLLCLAGAGTGKTHTLITKILYQTEILNIDPECILALTFTHAASSEMLARFKQYSNLTSYPLFTTFHSFCYSLLCKDQDILHHLGYSTVPNVIDDIQEKSLCLEVKAITGVKLPAKAFKLSYSPNEAQKFEYELFHKVLKRVMLERNLITFEQIISCITKLFIDCNPLISRYLTKFTHIYVDEFQDTDVLQWKFVQAFMKYSSICVVGDIRQNIYSFRGCTNSILKEIYDNGTWETHILDKNYRSTIEICNYANDFLKCFKDNYSSIELKSERHGSEVVAMSLSEFFSSIDNLETTNSAILCRTNKEVQYLCNILDNHCVSYQTNQSLLEIALYKCALDSNYCIDFFINQLPTEQQLNILSRKNFDKNFNILAYLEYVFTDQFKKIYDIQDTDEFYSMKQLYELGELSLSEISYMSQDTLLYVGTIHSVKGLEFSTVYVYGVNTPAFYVLSSEDNKNLFYVACTRAKDTLFIIGNSLEYLN